MSAPIHYERRNVLTCGACGNISVFDLEYTGRISFINTCLFCGHTNRYILGEETLKTKDAGSTDTGLPVPEAVVIPSTIAEFEASLKRGPGRPRKDRDE